MPGYTGAFSGCKPDRNRVDVVRPRGADERDK